MGWRAAAGGLFGVGSFGNGSAMRVAPLGTLGILGGRRDDHEARESADAGRPDAEMARRPGPRGRTGIPGELGWPRYPGRPGIGVSIQAGPPSRLLLGNGTGYLGARTAVATVIRAGGDVDTTAAIVGGIVALATGAAGIPGGVAGRAGGAAVTGRIQPGCPQLRFKWPPVGFAAATAISRNSPFYRTVASLGRNGGRQTQDPRVRGLGHPAPRRPLACPGP